MARRISCEQISPLLSAYLDGELSKAERQSVEWHLRECEACRGELRELEKAKKFALQLGEIQPPISLRQKIMARVEKEKECETVRPLLGAYLDEEIVEAERKHIELHLIRCADCRKELEATKKVREILRTLPEVELPSYSRARIYASIQRRPVFVRRFALGFATLAAAASLVFFALPLHRPTPPPHVPIIAQQSAPSTISQTEPLLPKGAKSSTKAVVPGYRKPTLAVIPSVASPREEQPITITPPVKEEEEKLVIGETRPVVLPQPSEMPSASEAKEEPQEVAPMPPTSPTPVKVAVKLEPSLSDVLKEITTSVDKPSIPSKLTERLDKSIVIGVVRVEF